MLKSVLATSVDSHTISFAVRALRNLLSSSEEIALQVGKDQCVHSLLDIISGKQRNGTHARMSTAFYWGGG